jgi:hypothetical protein
MWNIRSFVMTATLLLAPLTSAYADTFANTVDFADTTSGGVTFSEVKQGSGSYSHDLGYLNALAITDATLTIRANNTGNVNSNKWELWAVTGDDHTLIGSFGDKLNQWVDYAFTSYKDANNAVHSLADLFAGGDATLEVRLTDTSNLGTGSLLIDSSILSGTYTPRPVPIPATVLLMGSGLAGLGLFRRRRA